MLDTQVTLCRRDVRQCLTHSMQTAFSLRHRISTTPLPASANLRPVSRSHLLPGALNVVNSLAGGSMSGQASMASSVLNPIHGGLSKV